MHNILRQLVGLLLVFVFLFASAYPTLAANKRVPILTYHYIRLADPKDKTGLTLSVTPDNFDQQMTYLQQNGYTPINLDSLAAIYAGQEPMPTKPIVLTFDDGYLDFYTNAFPILQKYHFCAVAFIPTSLIGQGYYLNWDQIKEMQSSGLVTFEDHSMTHPYLTKMTTDQIRQELQTSKRTLEEQTGRTVNFVAYPFGASNAKVIQIAKQSGYIGGVGTWSGKASGMSLNMPRIRINGQFSLKTFALKI